MEVNNGEITSTKVFSFCYGHRLPDYDGCCKRQHGHNSSLEVTIKSAKNRIVYDGMVIDFKDIKRIVEKKITDVLDHKFLNEDIDYFTYTNPTAENMIKWVVTELDKIFEDNSLVRVKLSETPTSYSEWARK